MSQEKILLYTGNHDQVGISDYIFYFKKKYAKQIVMSNQLSHKYKKVIIIENFSNFHEIKKINKFINLYQGIKILVLTEFFNEIGKNKFTFNSFETCISKTLYIKSNTLFFSFLLFSIFFHNFMKTLSIFFSLFNLGKLYIFKKNYTKKIFIIKIVHNLYQEFKIQKSKIMQRYTKFIANDHMFIHFFLRYYVTKYFLKKFDSFILSHEKIINTKIKKNFFPQHSKIPFVNWLICLNPNNINLNKKNFIVTFSGGVTDYRLKVLKKIKINKKIFQDSLKTLSLQSFIISKQDKNSLLFSLHPKKTQGWKFSSPTRYINSIRKGEIPILVDNFNDIYSSLGLKPDILLFNSKRKIVNKLRLYKKKINKDQFQ